MPEQVVFLSDFVRQFPELQDEETRLRWVSQYLGVKDAPRLVNDTDLSVRSGRAGNWLSGGLRDPRLVSDLDLMPEQYAAVRAGQAPPANPLIERMISAAEGGARWGYGKQREMVAPDKPSIIDRMATTAAGAAGVFAGTGMGVLPAVAAPLAMGVYGAAHKQEGGLGSRLKNAMIYGGLTAAPMVRYGAGKLVPAIGAVGENALFRTIESGGVGVGMGVAGDVAAGRPIDWENAAIGGATFSLMHGAGEVARAPKIAAEKAARAEKAAGEAEPGEPTVKQAADLVPGLAGFGRESRPGGLEESITRPPWLPHGEGEPAPFHISFPQNVRAAGAGLYESPLFNPAGEAPPAPPKGPPEPPPPPEPGTSYRRHARITLPVKPPRNLGLEESITRAPWMPYGENEPAPFHISFPQNLRKAETASYKSPLFNPAGEPPPEPPKGPPQPPPPLKAEAGYRPGRRMPFLRPMMRLPGRPPELSMFKVEKKPGAIKPAPKQPAKPEPKPKYTPEQRKLILRRKAAEAKAKAAADAVAKAEQDAADQAAAAAAKVKAAGGSGGPGQVPASDLTKPLRFRVGEEAAKKAEEALDAYTAENEIILGTGLGGLQAMFDKGSRRKFEEMSKIPDRPVRGSMDVAAAKILVGKPWREAIEGISTDLRNAVPPELRVAIDRHVEGLRWLENNKGKTVEDMPKGMAKFMEYFDFHAWERAGWKTQIRQLQSAGGKRRGADNFMDTYVLRPNQRAEWAGWKIKDDLSAAFKKTYKDWRIKQDQKSMEALSAEVERMSTARAQQLAVGTVKPKSNMEAAAAQQRILLDAMGATSRALGRKLGWPSFGRLPNYLPLMEKNVPWRNVKETIRRAWTNRGRFEDRQRRAAVSAKGRPLNPFRMRRSKEGRIENPERRNDVLMDTYIDFFSRDVSHGLAMAHNKAVADAFLQAGGRKGVPEGAKAFAEGLSRYSKATYGGERFGLGAGLNALFESNAVGRVIHDVVLVPARKALNRSIFSGNLRFVFGTQPLSAGLIYARTNERIMAQATQLALDPAFRKNIEENNFGMVSKLRGRGSVTKQETTTGGESLRRRGPTGKLLDAAQEPVRIMEKELSMLAAAAAHIHGTELGLTGERLNNYITDMILNTQTDYGNYGRPEMLRSKALTALFPLQSFKFEMTNTGYEMVSGIGGEGTFGTSKAANAKALLRYMAWTVIMNQLNEAVFGRAPTSLGSNVPFSNNFGFDLVQEDGKLKFRRLDRPGNLMGQMGGEIVGPLWGGKIGRAGAVLARNIVPGGVEIERIIGTYVAYMSGEITDAEIPMSLISGPWNVKRRRHK